MSNSVKLDLENLSQLFYLSKKQLTRGKNGWPRKDSDLISINLILIFQKYINKPKGQSIADAAGVIGVLARYIDGSIH